MNRGEGKREAGWIGKRDLPEKITFHEERGGPLEREGKGSVKFG